MKLRRKHWPGRPGSFSGRVSCALCGCAVRGDGHRRFRVVVDTSRPLRISDQLAYLETRERQLPSPVLYAAAFEKLLDECLAIGERDQFVVLFDESFLRYLDALTRIVVARNVPTTFLMIPMDYQRYLCDWLHRLPGETWLPVPVEEAVSRAHGVLNVLSGDAQTLPVRKAILSIPRSNECRLAHVPGISDEVLRLVECSPFGRILSHSELVAWALGEATHATLETYDAAGRPYVLTMDLGGWKNEPLMSPGLLLPGSWGNVPPGETFCCPDPSQVNGEVCISGSVPGYVLKPHEEVVLTFAQGRLTHWRSESESPAVSFFNSARDNAERLGDLHWNLFAELGVGLNPAIADLTGNSLYDEKVAGTVHVAIGDNQHFGHDNRSNLHADLAILRPTLKLPMVDVMSGGKLAIEEIEAARRKWRPPHFERGPGSSVSLKGAQVTERDGRLLRRLCKAGRVGHLRMGSDELGVALATVAKHLVGFDQISIAALRDVVPALVSDGLDMYLDVLQHYDCVEIR